MQYIVNGYYKWVFVFRCHQFGPFVNIYTKFRYFFSVSDNSVVHYSKTVFRIFIQKLNRTKSTGLTKKMFNEQMYIAEINIFIYMFNGWTDVD